MELAECNVALGTEQTSDLLRAVAMINVDLAQLLGGRPQGVGQHLPANSAASLLHDVQLNEAIRSDSVGGLDNRKTVRRGMVSVPLLHGAGVGAEPSMATPTLQAGPAPHACTHGGKPITQEM